LDTVSSDQGPGAPSFGDLFDDPDAPLAPLAPDAEAPSPGVVSLGAAPSASSAPAPVADEHREHQSWEPAGFEDAEADDLDDDETDSDRAADVLLEAHPDRDAATDRDDSALLPPLAAAMAASAAWDGVPDAQSAAPAGRVDTGRLYRSAGAEGPHTLDAIPAIDPGHTPPPVAKAARADSSDVVAAGGGTGLTYAGVGVVVVAATVLMAFADALITNRIGTITGLALLVSSVYAAVVVRRSDIWAAVVVPPLAFLAATLTAGQLTLDKTGSLLIREGYMVFRTLAVNAPWILGTTLVCLVIVLLRRRRTTVRPAPLP
jgi:hypothetical protein